MDYDATIKDIQKNPQKYGDVWFLIPVQCRLFGAMTEQILRYLEHAGMAISVAAVAVIVVGFALAVATADRRGARACLTRSCRFSC